MTAVDHGMGRNRHHRTAVVVNDNSVDAPVVSQTSTEQSSLLHLALARLLYTDRMTRPGGDIPGFYGEANWDLLLDLYIRDNLSKRTAVSAACIGAQVPPTTALRHINILCDTGWLQRARDKTDRRVNWLRLTPYARDRMDAYFAALSKKIEALGFTAAFAVAAPPTLDGSLEQLRGLVETLEGLVDQRS